MSTLTDVIAAVLVACIIGGPATASAAPLRSQVRTEAASDAANQAVAESLYRAFAVGDGAAIGGLLAADLVWVEAESHPYADRNPYNGPAAVFEGVFGRIGAAFDGFAATPRTYLVRGDTVVAFGRYTGTNKASGEVLDAQFAHVFTVTGGRITHFQQYTDTAEWVDVMTSD